ncbi:MAG: hypothetical protein AAGB10_10000 [Pseudomonadota bacterium]
MTQKPLNGTAEHEIYRRRGARNLAVGGCLVGVVLMIFAVTLVKLSAGVEIRGFDHTFETVPGEVIE